MKCAAALLKFTYNGSRNRRKESFYFKITCTYHESDETSFARQYPCLCFLSGMIAGKQGAAPSHFGLQYGRGGGSLTLLASSWNCCLQKSWWSSGRPSNFFVKTTKSLDFLRALTSGAPPEARCSSWYNLPRSFLASVDKRAFSLCFVFSANGPEVLSFFHENSFARLRTIILFWNSRSFKSSTLRVLTLQVLV